MIILPFHLDHLRVWVFRRFRFGTLPPLLFVFKFFRQQCPSDLYYTFLFLWTQIPKHSQHLVFYCRFCSFVRSVFNSPQQIIRGHIKEISNLINMLQIRFALHGLLSSVLRDDFRTPKLSPLTVVLIQVSRLVPVMLPAPRSVAATEHFILFLSQVRIGSFERIRKLSVVGVF